MYKRQRSSHVRSSCADEIIAAALGDGTNKRTSKSPDPRQNNSRLRNNHSGLNTESLGPAPIHFVPSRGCANLLEEWGVPDSQPPSHDPKGAENASAQLNCIERMLDDSVAEREHVAHKQVHPPLLLSLACATYCIFEVVENLLIFCMLILVPNISDADFGNMPRGTNVALRHGIL